MKNLIKTTIDRYFDEVKALCTELYNNPEISNEEYKSCELISNFLLDKGFNVKKNAAKLPTAFLATKSNGVGAKIAIAVEYDALLNMGHACGHHQIAAMSILAGLAVKEVLGHENGTISLFGTPAEETGDGKIAFIEHGLIQEYDCALILHPFLETILDPIITAVGAFDFTFIGQPSHAGAAPHNGVNALDAVVNMYNSMSMLRQQLRDGSRVGAIITEGGTAVNIIPDRCVIRFELRSDNQKYYEYIVQRTIDAANAAALATGCTVSWEESIKANKAMRANPVLLRLFENTLNEYGIEYNDKMQASVSSDISEFAAHIPAIHPLVRMTENNENLHTEEFLCAMNKPYAWEKMREFSTLLADVAVKIIMDEQILTELKKEKINFKEDNL